MDALIDSLLNQRPKRSVYPKRYAGVPSSLSQEETRNPLSDRRIRRQRVGDTTERRSATKDSVERLLEERLLAERRSVARNMNNRNINQQRRSVGSNQELLLELKKLQQFAREQAETIAQQEQQLEIKNDALQRQTEDIKKLDGELVWTRAALYQAEHSHSSNIGNEAQDTDWQDKYVRLQAEMDNLRKRWETRSVEKVREERNRILMDMLPLADHLELALKHNHPLANTTSKQVSSVDAAFIGNIRATLSAFISALQRYDVEPIEALGEPFDPSLHEAVGQASNATIPADHIAEVIQTGYRDGERLLRPARVMVSTG